MTGIVCGTYFFGRGGPLFWMPVFAIAGLIGGLVYWSLAGRSAGDWRGPPASP